MKLTGSEKIVEGKIISCRDKKPLAFATVLTNNFGYATSDENGDFKLSMATSNSIDSIFVSYVGFITVRETVTKFIESKIVCMEESAMLLNEVVVRTKQLDHAKLFGKFRVIRDNLYAQESETAIAEFNLFLKEIEGTALFTKCTYDLADYPGAVKEFYERYHANTTEPKHGRRVDLAKEEGSFAHYPVVNISHDAAIAYCQWLTDEYNNQKKRKFKKVKFRLPTINEWQIAALGYSDFQSWNLDENDVKVHVPYDSTKMIDSPGKDISIKASDILYPWYKAYHYRKKSQTNKYCFLGNFKVPEVHVPCFVPKVAGDRFSMMGHVGSYFPNNIGLYDVVGNVAEMIDQNGKACGGSWNHLPGECTIRSVATYVRPNPWVGFRVFMEVLEK